jgi:hemerythrin superfamily protein
MDLVSFLKREHGHINTLLEKLADTSEGAVKTREKLFDQVKTDLETHSAIEEKQLYPRLKKQPELKDLEKHAEQEHHRVSQMLRQIAKMPVDGEEFMQKVEELTSAVRSHVEEEEQEILPKAEDLLGKEECDRIAKLLHEEKLKLMQPSR